MNISRRFDPNTHYAIQEQHPDADTSHVKRKYLDIPNATLSPLQKLDVYLPDEGNGPFPVIVSIHGGAFMGCDKADEQILPMLEGLKRGYAVVALNYRLSWEATFPALVHDVKSAVRWIRANGGHYHFDPDRIAAWGGSAGAYLASRLGTPAGVSELEDLSLGNLEQMSIHFAAKLEQVLGKGRVQLELLEGAEHGDPRFEFPENVERVLDFLDKHLGGAIQ